MSKYQVIARKFRPQVFEDVVGQKPIVQTLKNAIQMDRIGHAYLFSGPRGVGKTTTARILAKGLNCARGPTITPCNECASCQEISSGKSIDVFEIDAASNTGVDNIRELRESAKYAAARSRYKIFIIDEVHMLSTSAFNALLKILEEPPSHVVFIMATTERHKLPATILSRCQQFIFRMISPGEIQAHLRQIAVREGVKIDDRSLSYIVKASEGSMRDAQSLLDQIISFSGQEVVDEDVRDVLGFIPGEILARTLDALADRNSKALLEDVGIVVDQGLSLQQYVRELIGRIRDLLILKLGLEEKILGSAEE
ncbi:MAG TPA: DNA polymerase III subunit gamma/tau, partial [Terriglobia bacterium]|nr:DNA polymerase III subunit gamma/tau [Terriglobia bacterium]